jgi:hypothetical protein
MVLCAYHASHEQFTPSALVRSARLAEQAGFTAVSSLMYSRGVLDRFQRPGGLSGAR